MSCCLKRSIAVAETFSRYTKFRRISQSIPKMTVAIPQPDNQPKTFSPKIQELAESIAQLNLIEVAELSDLLKKKLNLPDAPVMGFGGFAAGAAPAAPKKEEEEQAELSQTSFTVKLKKFDEKQKIALIKEIKNIMEDFNLVQAKKFVESTPGIVKSNVGKDEAEKLKAALEKVGAEIEIS